MAEQDRPLTHPDLTPEEARARAVAAVLAEQAVRTEARRRRRTEPTTTWRRVIALVVLTVTALYLWIASPAWLAPPPPPPVPVERIEAGLRLAVYLQAQRVRDFRAERGRLPAVLEEAGEPLAGLRYERIDARTYRIRAFAPGGSMLYVSTDSLPAFVGDADRRLGLVP